MSLFGKSEEDKGYILSKSAAEAEIKKIFDYYEIDPDEIEDKKAKDMIQAGYSRLIQAVRRGRIEVKIDGGMKIVQHLKADANETIIYREIDAIAKKASDGMDPNAYYGRIYAIMGSLSGMGDAAIAKLKGVDLSLCETLGAIFLSV